MTGSRAEYRLDELRIEDAKLGEGGAAEIHRCETADGKPMLLKRYNDEALQDLDADALRHLIGWPARLPVNHREQLMTMCAWPQAAVIDDGAVIGVLMGEAPTKFFFRQNDKLVPRHFTYVAVTKENAEKRNRPYYDFPHKIARFGHLLEALQLGHSYKIVEGDLQPNNILTTSPEPDATGHVTTENFLLDCDSFIVDGRHAFPPMDPQNMRPPYDVDGPSATTDLYKFAKVMIRCLSEDLAADAIYYDKFSNVLPSRDFEMLERLLTWPDPGLTADDLGNLARAWQATVRPDGRLFCRTNRSLREPWTEEKRRAHLAGLGGAVPPSREVGEGARGIHQQPAFRSEAHVDAGEPIGATTATAPATEPRPGRLPVPQPPPIVWPPPQPPPGWRPVPQPPWWRRANVALIGAIALLCIGGFVGYQVLFANSDGGVHSANSANSDGSSPAANSGGASHAAGSDEDQIKQLVQTWTNDLNNRDVAALKSSTIVDQYLVEHTAYPQSFLRDRDQFGTLSTQVTNITANRYVTNASVLATWSDGTHGNWLIGLTKDSGTWKISSFAI